MFMCSLFLTVRLLVIFLIGALRWRWTLFHLLARDQNDEGDGKYSTCSQYTKQYLAASQRVTNRAGGYKCTCISLTKLHLPFRYSDESSQESGSSSDEQDEPVKKKKKPSLSLTPVSHY